MLKARRYDKPITLVLYSSVTDDFGKGEVETSEDVLYTFADISQTNSSRTRFENTNAQQEAYRFIIRYTNRVFNAVRWRGKEYIVQNIDNVNQANRELVINAQRVGNGAEPYTY